MQARHLDRKRYFEDSAITSARFYFSYINRFHPITKDSRILEIGCGEGGNLKPFAEAGCHVTGVDMAKARIELAKRFFEAEGLKGSFECDNFLKSPIPREESEKFDVLILHDVIEHIPNKDAFINHIRYFMKADGILFAAFPAWQMPFGGHQQICRSKIWSKFPFFHMLPYSLYRFILNKLAGEEQATTKELLDIKKCRCTIEQFEKIIKAFNLSVVNRKLWLVNPHYQQKFGLSPIQLRMPISHIPIIRNFCSTSCFYLLNQKSL